MKNRNLCWIGIALSFAAGCAQAPAKVPQFDYSKSDIYPAAAFKDNAPANAPLTADMPLSFVDSDGKPADLTQYRGKSKVVLVVLRGMPRTLDGKFCPHCLAQAGSLLANQNEFQRRHAQVLVVYPGPADRLGEFLQVVKRQTPGEPNRAYRVLLDQDCGACARLGIRADLAKPSTYILDTHGQIVYAYVGQTTADRPSVKAVLAQLDKTP